MNNQPILLIVVDWFAPGYKAGGPIKSTVNIAMALKDHFNIKVLTTDTDHGETIPYTGVSTNRWVNYKQENVQVYYARKSTLSRKQLADEIIGANASHVYLNHIWSPYFVLYPMWLKYTGRVKSKLVVCPRGALYDSALKIKSYKKKPLLKLMKWMRVNKYITFHATNQREKEAIERFFPGSTIVVADNIPGADHAPFTSCPKIAGELKCIFIARVLPIKNLLFLLNAFFGVKQNVSLTIVGPIEDQAYWSECESVISRLPQNIRVDYVGPKANNELLPLLQQHHLFVLPTTGENFGHSIFEAFLAGRPVLISDQTPWLNLAEKRVGYDLPLNNIEGFTNALEQAASWTQNQFDEHGTAAWQFAQSYIEQSEVKEKYVQMFS